MFLNPNSSSDLKMLPNSRPTALNFNRFSRSLEFFFFTVGRNNFGNKIPILAYLETVAYLRWGSVGGPLGPVFFQNLSFL